jgi:serine/threonine-protein kinase HipA
VRQRILTTNISLDEATCDIALVQSVGEYFGLAQAKANTVIRQVAIAASRWRDAAAACGAMTSEIQRMESAFEHIDLKRALAL